MRTKTITGTTLRRTLLAIILCMALCSCVQAGLNWWSGTGPFAPAAGQRAVYALAISPDGTTIYSGLNSGTVMSLTFGPRPVVGSVTPSTGPEAGGTVVTIAGSGFTGAIAVRFGTTDATAYTVVSDTEITATAPAGTAGAVDVLVTTPGGTSLATSGDLFTYTGAATRLFVSAPAAATAGTPFTFTVAALDALGSTATDYAGTVHFTSSDSAPTLPADYTFVSGDAGTHTFTSGATLTSAGTHTISANDTVTGSINGNTGPIAVSPGPATHFTVTAPATSTAGSSFSITVTALDDEGNTATGYSGTVNFASSDGAATLPASATLTSGTGSFSTTLNTAGTQTITATDAITPSITGTSGTITVSPGPAARFAVSAPAAATAGSAFTFTVTALDTGGNTDPGYTGTVHFTSTDGAATLPADATLTAGTGTFGATLATAGTQTITATDTVTASITGASGTIAVSPGPATSFTVIAPATAAGGAPVTVTVTARDQYGNTATGYAGTVHITSSDGSAILPPDSTLSGGAGTFSVTFGTGGPQTITATDTVTASVNGTSGSIAVRMVTHYAVSAPVSVTRGSAFTFTVTALDDSNTPVTGYAGTLHFTSTDPVATLPTDATLAAGTGTFSCTLGTIGTRTITATDTVTASITGTSGIIAVTAPVVPTATPTYNPTPGPDPLTDIDPGTGGSGGNSGGSAGSAGSSGTGFPLMTVTVNIGGDTKAWQAIVTGTQLSGLIVTGTEQHGAVAGCTAPAGSVFQYLSLEPARYGTITNAVINFSIPQSWLDQNHIAPGSVVIYHMTPDCWKALPTTFLSTKDGNAYFSVQSGGFSSFAIAGTPAAGAPAATATIPREMVTGAVQSPAPVFLAKAPVATETTAPPVPAKAPEPGFPAIIVALIGAGCFVLIGGGWYVRRWWIRRQNPALFREYD